MKLLKASKTNKAPELDNLPVSGIKRSFRLIHVLLTLGARDFRGFWFRSSFYSDPLFFARGFGLRPTTKRLRCTRSPWERKNLWYPGYELLGSTTSTCRLH